MGCGCAALMGLLIGPRVAFFFVWIFTGWVGKAFNGVLLPLLGVLVLPWTTLLYTVAYGVFDGGFFALLAMFGGLLLDIGSYASSSIEGRRRYT